MKLMQTQDIKIDQLKQLIIERIGISITQEYESEPNECLKEDD